MLKISVMLIVLAFSWLRFPVPVMAAGELIHNFDTQITAQQDGTMIIDETIKYDFGENVRHGIYRDIPKIAKVGDLYRVMKINFQQVLRDGQAENYQDNSTPETASIKIGNANQTITGERTYTISYLVENGIGSNFDDHDEIFWNVTGNSWQVPIEKASVKIFAPVLPGPNMICYTGVYNSKEQNCTFATDQTDTPVLTTKTLLPGEGLSVAWEFPVNTFPKSILQKELSTPTAAKELNPLITNILLISLFAIPIILNFILAPFLLIWYFKKKHKNRFGPPAVNFDFPEDDQGKRVTPAEAGSIDNYQVDQNDLIATIFDLAIRRYLKIEQVKTEKILGVFGSDEDYQFKKLKKTDETNTEFEKKLMERMFEDGDKVKLSSLKTDFYETFREIEKDIFQSLIDKGFYSKNPKNQMAVLLVGGIMVIFIGGLLLGPVLIYLSRKLNGRTAKGDEMDWKIDGLKIFLKNMSREHTWQAKNLITVEKYIPYAIALGFIKEFMEQLKVIYPDYQPTWYSGNMAFYLASSSMLNSMNSNFTTHAPSSSSGFSGGGFSGGGGGGGGGGSW